MFCKVIVKWSVMFDLTVSALANCANMLASIWTYIVGQYVGQHFGAVCYRHLHVGEKTSKNVGQHLLNF